MTFVVDEHAIKDIKMVYVAGPFSGKTRWDVHLNVHRNELICAKIWERCAGQVIVISPHQNSKNIVGLIDEKHIVAGYLSLVDRSDALFVTEGWRWSSGTKGEILRAMLGFKPIFTNIDDLCLWVKGGDFSHGPCPLCKDPDTVHRHHEICDDCLKVIWPQARYHPKAMADYVQSLYKME